MGLVAEEVKLNLQAPIVFIVGLPGVGKTTLGDYLASTLNSVCINSGDALRAFLRREEVELNDHVNTGSVFLNRFGEQQVGPAIMQEADKVGARIIDGPRLFVTLDYCESIGRTVFVAFLTAEDGVRRDRFRRRSLYEHEATQSTVNLLLEKKDEWGADLPRFAKISRWSFDNSGSIDLLRKFGDSIANELSES